MQDNIYLERYEDICDEIGRACVSIGVLNGIGTIGNEQLNYKDPRYKVISLLCELTKRDLALTVWKIYLDTNSKANMVKSLNNYLKSKEINTNTKMRLSPEVKSITNDLSNIRKEYLAHLDYNTINHKLNMELTTKMYFEIVEMAKGLYRPDVDERVKPINDNCLHITMRDATIGTIMIIDELRMNDSD